MPGGVVTVTVVAVLPVTLPAAPPKVTLLPVMLVPVMVTEVPPATGPLSGAMAVKVGSTAYAGVATATPAAVSVRASAVPAQIRPRGTGPPRMFVVANTLSPRTGVERHLVPLGLPERRPEVNAFCNTLVDSHPDCR
ncbi:hypothetical protein GCM10010399_90430 [Dactylosporangium fulvum]